MDFTYVIILVVVLIISPFVLKFASDQKKQTKQQLKFIFLGLLCTQLLLGFLSGLQIFLVISVIQILLLLSKYFKTLVVVLNFINSVVIFAEMINMSNKAGYQIFSLPAIAAVFVVLIGNVIGLAFINKDKNLHLY